MAMDSSIRKNLSKIKLQKDKNYTMIQIVRSMLILVNVPHSFLGKAASTANHFRNSLLTNANDKLLEEN